MQNVLETTEQTGSTAKVQTVHRATFINITASFTLEMQLKKLQQQQMYGAFWGASSLKEEIHLEI